jgi:hypothetical protein
MCSKGYGASETVSAISVAHAGDQFGQNRTLDLRNSARFHNFNASQTQAKYWTDGASQDFERLMTLWVAVGDVPVLAA